MAALKPPYPLILNGLRGGRVVPFLGSGASLAARGTARTWTRESAEHLPSAGELAKHLAAMSQFPEDSGIDLAAVAQYYGVVAGRTALRQELNAIFDGDFAFGPLHEFLASIPHPMLIVTTNYDDLLERAFQAQNRPFDIVVHTTDEDLGDRLLLLRHGETKPTPVNPNKLDLDLTATSVIYKMHGAVDRRKLGSHQFVVSEDDYIDFLARMTKRKAIPAMFAEPFETRHFLFLGYSLRDWNLRVVLNRLRHNLRGITSWSVQFQPSPLEVRIWQDRGVEVYDMTLDDFVQQLTATQA